MRTTAIATAFVSSLSPLCNALLVNKTNAYADGNLEKYKCIDTEGVNDMLPECLHQCQRDANSQDGCGYDDFACHCANYDTYSPVSRERLH